MPRLPDNDVKFNSLGSDDSRLARATRGPLVPCPGCARHVFAGVAAVEGTCPFCASELPTDLAHRAAPAATKRLTRGETFGFNRRTAIPLADLDAVAGGIQRDALGIATGGSLNPVGGSLGATGLVDDGGSQFSMYGAPGQSWDLDRIGAAERQPNDLPPSDPGERGPDLTDPGSGAAAYGAPGQDGWNFDDAMRNGNDNAPGPPDDDQGGVHAEYGAPITQDDWPPDTGAGNGEDDAYRNNAGNDAYGGNDATYGGNASNDAYGGNDGAYGGNAGSDAYGANDGGSFDANAGADGSYNSGSESYGGGEGYGGDNSE